MAEARYTCPDCGTIDLTIENEGLKDAEGNSLGRATCPNCAWTGPLSQTVGIVTSGQLWDIERVGAVLLRTVSIHSAGPMVQCLEFIGLLPKKKEIDTTVEPAVRAEQMRFNDAAQKARDAVMRRVCEASITAAFEEAERVNRLFAIEMGTDIHPMLQEPVETQRTTKPEKKKRRKR